MKSDQSKMSRWLSFLSWTFGIILGIVGFTGTLSQGPEGLGLLITSFMFMPPVVQYMKKKTGFKIGAGIRIVALLVSFMLIGLVSGHRDGTIARGLEDARIVGTLNPQTTEGAAATETSAVSPSTYVAAATSQDDYWIKASAISIGERRFELEIETNIPGNYQLATSLALQNQEPEDVFIGTEFQRVPVSGGITTAIVDGTQLTFPINSTLPAGDYWIEVCFHPLWSENRSVAEACNITGRIEAKIPVTIGEASDAIRTSGHYLSSYEKDYLSRKYNELLNFVATAEFAQYGFASGGPYNGWLTDLETWEQSDPSFWGGVIANEIMQLGLAYVFENENNISYFNECIPEEIESYSE